MSTPERPQDPGEHGYGGTQQDYPAGDEDDDAGAPAEGGDHDPREAPAPEEPDETA
jgi:hypothetical protein